MKFFLLLLITVASFPLFANNEASFKLEVGKHMGVTPNNKICSLTISDEVGDCFACSYMLTVAKGKKIYKPFSVLKGENAVKYDVQEDGLYFSKQDEIFLGGTYLDNLDLVFNGDKNISSVRFEKEARLFGSNTVVNCELNNPIGYSVINN